MRTFVFTLIAFAGLTALAQPRVLTPEHVMPMPTEAEVAAYNKVMKSGKAYDALTARERAIIEAVEENPVYDDLYSGKCSWYCGGEVDTVIASSCLKPIKSFTYEGQNAHDFDHESVWAEGAKGAGIGEWLCYYFKGGCPRITHVLVLNGHVKSEKAWRNNGRVKKLLMYYNDEPYAVLCLDDSRSCQRFDVGILGYNDPESPEWTLKFEILEVYPGAKYDDTVISELYFDGIDVH